MIKVDLLNKLGTLIPSETPEEDPEEIKFFVNFIKHVTNNGGDVSKYVPHIIENWVDKDPLNSRQTLVQEYTNNLLGLREFTSEDIEKSDEAKKYSEKDWQDLARYDAINRTHLNGVNLRTKFLR